jgi:hypothetical protein
VTRNVLASLATAALLALAPAAALAQDAGSQQYQDPLAGDTNSNNSNGNGGGSGGNTRPSNTGNAQAETDTGTQAAAASNDGLPRTGLDAWLLLLAGGTLLGGGFALRRVADRPRA